MEVGAVAKVDLIVFLTIAVTQTQTPCLRDGEMKVVMLSVQQGTTRQALPSL